MKITGLQAHQYYRCAFYRLNTGEKLLFPAEMQAKMTIAEQEALLFKQEALDLAAQLAAYKARFGSFDS